MAGNQKTSSKETIDNVRQEIIYNKETQLEKIDSIRQAANFRTGKQEIISNTQDRTLIDNIQQKSGNNNKFKKFRKHLH